MYQIVRLDVKPILKMIPSPQHLHYFCPIDGTGQVSTIDLPTYCHFPRKAASSGRPQILSASTASPQETSPHVQVIFVVLISITWVLFLIKFTLRILNFLGILNSLQNLFSN